MRLSWISNRSLKLSPKARLVEDDETEVLRQKLAALAWKPENGFLKDRGEDGGESPESRSTEAA